MRSASQHVFASAPQVSVPRSSFRRNYTHKTTFDAGWLVPVVVDEVLPGDTFNLKLTAFARLLSPLKYPIMDNLYMDFQFFFVANRLLWDSWESAIGANAAYDNDPTVPQETLIPVVTSSGSGFGVGTLYDYMGIPPTVTNLSVSCLPLRAYNRIYNDWYRDTNLCPAADEEHGDTTDASHFVLKRRAKRHDYFTSSLPWPQKGPGVELPLGSASGPVTTDGSNVLFGVAGTTLGANMVLGAANTSGNRDIMTTSSGLTTGAALKWPTSPNWTAHIEEFGSVTINSLRQAFQIQRLYERDARGGSGRYVELLQAHFGVTSPDARLQRAEYLGGGSVPIQIHTVANTAGTNASGNVYQAELAAYGVTASSNLGFVKSFVEHGWIIGIASVRADLTYQQGLNRMWSRRSRFDFYWPALACLGEQAVLNKEIYAQGASTKDDDGNVIDDQVFGYQERFAEYRYGQSLITGKLRSQVSNPLDSWHLAQRFQSLPTLSQQFIEEDPPMDRVSAVTNEPKILYDSLVELNCVRPMPLFGIPGMVDHF